jgi:RNA polymerase sigma factor (sigma-70 family)
MQAIEARPRRGTTEPSRRGTLEEERALLESAQRGDRRALEKVVLAHRPLVIALARRYGGPTSRQNWDDLVAEGMLALVDAARRYDASRGTRFATYAQHWVRHYVVGFSLGNRRAVAAPSTRAMRRLGSWLGRTQRALEHERGRAPTREELAETLHVTVKDIEDAESYLGGRDVPTHEDPTMGHWPVAEDASPEDVVIARRQSTSDHARLRAALASLDERERSIVEARILDDDGGATLGDLGARLGVSRERVRQLEARALRKIHAKWIAA